MGKHNRISYYQDPLYSRWQTAVNRYLRKNSPVYINQDGRSLTMAKSWQPPDKHGFVAFKAWVDEELRRHPEITPDNFRILKKDKAKEFGPENCYLYQYGTGPRAGSREPKKVSVVQSPFEPRELERPEYQIVISPVSKTAGLDLLERLFVH